MESMAHFHRIYGIVPWNPLNFCGINGKNLWHFMNFPNFLLLIYLPSTAMETLKTPSEYSVHFNRGFQEFSMANLEKGCFKISYHKNWIYLFLYYLEQEMHGKSEFKFYLNLILKHKILI